MKITYDISDDVFISGGDLYIRVNGYSITDDKGNSLSKLSLSDCRVHAVKKTDELYFPALRLKDLDNFFRIANKNGARAGRGIPIKEDAVFDEKRRWY